MTLDPVYYWLAGFVCLGIAYFAAKGKVREHLATVLLLLATIFVGTHIYSMFESSKGSASVSTSDADRAELSLRMAQALKSTERLLYIPKVGPKNQFNRFRNDTKKENETKLQVNAMYTDAQKVLDQVIQKNPTSASSEAKYAIVTHELDEPNDVSIDRLDHIDKPEAHEMAKALRYIYTPVKPSAAATASAEETFKRLFPNGYYRETTLSTLYLKAGKKAEYESLQAELEKHCLNMVVKMVALLIFVVLSVLGGLAIIVVHFFFLPRSPSAEEVALVRSPIKFSPKVIFGVLIAWQATQIMLGTLLHASGIHLLKAGESTLKMAALTGALYVLSNGPCFLYIYLIAIKPHGLKFFDSIKMRPRVGKFGPARLVLFGVLTWIAAFPVVLTAFFIAARFFGSQGSQNPIIAIVMEASRTADFGAVLVFYFTLGVLAPLCEETLFRGFLYASLRQYWPMLPCLLLTAALFAGVHMDMGGFLPLFALGFLFAYTLERTKSTVSSMVAHGLWNSGTFTVCLLLFGGN